MITELNEGMNLKSQKNIVLIYYYYLYQVLLFSLFNNTLNINQCSYLKNELMNFSSISHSGKHKASLYFCIWEVHPPHVLSCAAVAASVSCTDPTHLPLDHVDPEEEPEVRWAQLPQIRWMSLHFLDGIGNSTLYFF